jgi:hypothetical protein
MAPSSAARRPKKKPRWLPPAGFLHFLIVSCSSQLKAANVPQLPDLEELLRLREALKSAKSKA